MSHQGRCGLKVECNAKALRRCLDRLLPAGMDQQFVFAASCTWSATTLIATALFWAWSDEDTLTGRFRVARRITTRCFFLQQELATAYQPFMRMLVRWSGRLQALLVAQLHNVMRAMDSFTENGFAIFAIDGSRFELPRTAGNEQVFSPRDDNGKRKRHVRKKRTTGDQKKSTSPQVWLTTLWHVGCGLPWAWTHGESGSSERQHLLQMLPELPDNALLTADAGFAGYEYWKAILDSQRNFLIRVGANVKLLKKLGYARESARRIYLWTDRAAAREQPPLVLRLVIVQGARHPVYLVTSVLSSAQLTDSQLSKIYARRWGVELYYRHVKQTFDLRKLRSAARPRMSCWNWTGRSSACGVSAGWRKLKGGSSHGRSAWRRRFAPFGAPCENTKATPTPAKTCSHRGPLLASTRTNASANPVATTHARNASDNSTVSLPSRPLPTPNEDAPMPSSKYNEPTQGNGVGWHCWLVQQC